MDEASVDPEPMTQLSRWLDAARGAGQTMPEAMAVATATPDGLPSARMVLLRGLDHRGLVFYTDRESEKGRELMANPFAAALFHWFLPAHRQVRVSGAVTVVDDVERRVAELTETFPGDEGPPRPPRWGGFRIRPEVVELWEEGADRLHDRLRYRPQSGGWALERLSP
jgi:pyridoxamine 5'-phosphate oxidase